MGGLQAVVFLLLNKREVKTRIAESEGYTAASKQRVTNGKYNGPRQLLLYIQSVCTELSLAGETDDTEQNISSLLVQVTCSR